MDESNRPLLDAVIVPHRSLSPRGFLVLMAVTSLIAFIGGLFFLIAGAWPVFGFLGLDVLIIYLAFRANYRSGRAREEVLVTREEVRIRRFAPNGRMTSEVALNPYWVRLEPVREADSHLARLDLTSHGERHTVAAALSAPEREGFASAMAEALAAARR